MPREKESSASTERRCRERKREAAESQYREEREKIHKKLYAHATVPVQICTGTVATCIYAQVCMD